MGSAVSAVTGAVGNIAGSAIGGLGGGIFNASGAKNNFQTNPYDLQQQQFSDAIKQSQQGITSNTTQQQQLANALLAQSQGQGPNPAQQMLNQATNQNVQQGAGMIASQRGINPGLATRLASQQTSQANQQAAGQGALMGAQQQLAAQGQLGNLYGQMGGQQLQYQGLLQNAQSQQNAQNLQNYYNAQGINAGVAAQNSQEQANITGGLMGGLGALGGGMLGGGGGGAKQASGNSAGGGYSSNTNMFAFQGGKVNGIANVDGDSIQNDTEQVELSPGEIVIPRSKAADPDKAKAFIDSLEKSSGGEKDEMSFGHVVAAHKKLADKVAELEKRMKKN